MTTRQKIKLIYKIIFPSPDLLAKHGEDRMVAILTSLYTHDGQFTVSDGLAEYLQKDLHKWKTPSEPAKPLTAEELTEAYRKLKYGK